MKKIIISTIAFCIVLATGLVLYIRSEGFLDIIEAYASSKLNQPVSVGSIHLEKGNRIIIRDVTVEKKEKGNLRIILPETKVIISWGGIKKRMIDELIIIKPELLVPSLSKKKDTSTSDEISLPVDFKKVSIRDGSVIVSPTDKKDIKINELQLSLLHQDKEKTSKLIASARIPGFISTAEVEATVDVRNINVSEAHIALTGTDLGALHIAAGLKKSDKSVEGIADINFRIVSEKEAVEERMSWATEVLARDIFVRSGTVDLKPGDGSFSMKSSGIFRLYNSDLEINKCEIQLGGLEPLQLSGSLKNVLSGNPDISIVFSADRISLHKVKQIISGPSVNWFHLIDVKATGTLRLEVSGKLGAPAFSAAAFIRGEYLETAKMRIAGFETTLPVDYKDDILTIIKSSLKVNEGSFFDDRKEPIVRISGLSAMIPHIEYKKGKIRPLFLQINSDNAVFYRGGSTVLSERGITLKGMVDADVNGPIIMLKDLSLDGDSIKGISGEVSISQEKNPEIEAFFSWKGIDIKQLEQKALSSFLKEKGLSIHGTGNFNTTFRLSELKKGKSSVSGSIQISLADAGFSSADETNIGEGIQGELSGSYEISLPVDRINFAVQTHLTGFELLSGKFYGNFKDKQLSFSGAGSYTDSLRKLIVSQSETGLTGIGKVLFSGSAYAIDKSPFIDGEVRITEIANHEAFNFLLRETYKERFPFLSGIEIDGTTSARLYVNGSPDEFTVQGDIGISDMNFIGSEKNRTINGIHISLPVDLSYPEAGEVARDQSYGSVRVQDVSWGGIQLKDIELFPAIRQNALVLKEDASIRLFGGDIVLKDISYKDLLSPERALRLAVNLRNISLAEASVALEVPEFSGTLSGTIPRAVFSNGRLSTDGEIILELFDGTMRISDLSVDHLFSPVASIKSGIEIDDINLGKLTGIFDFGHISGIVSGRIKDLVIVNNQAQSFTTQLATVRKKGVDQKISVEALKKISILGTGTSTSLLDRGIYRFFKEYRYEKIGFSASLNNDNLLLLGIENTGNMGYLVKGGILPPKVDVINYTQNISFKEMVKRLKRIGQANN